MKNFNEQFRQMRKEKGLTQKKIAELLNTTDDTIFSWEKGRSEPSIEYIKKICCIFEVSADYLLGLEDEDGNKIYISNSFNNNKGTINFKG